MCNFNTNKDSNTNMDNTTTTFQGSDNEYIILNGDEIISVSPEDKNNFWFIYNETFNASELKETFLSIFNITELQKLQKGVKVKILSPNNFWREGNLELKLRAKLNFYQDKNVDFENEIKKSQEESRDRFALNSNEEEILLDDVIYNPNPGLRFSSNNLLKFSELKEKYESKITNEWERRINKKINNQGFRVKLLLPNYPWVNGIIKPLIESHIVFKPHN